MGKSVNKKVGNNEIKVYSYVEEEYGNTLEDITDEVNISILNPVKELTVLAKEIG